MVYLQSSKFSGALVLDNMFPKKVRAAVGITLNLALALLCLLAGYIFLHEKLQVFLALPIPALSVPFARVIGAVLLLSGIRLVFFALESFYRAQTYDYSGDSTSELILPRLTYPATDVWYTAAGSVLGMEHITIHELANALAYSETGKNTLLRLGISPADYIAGIAHAGTADRRPNESALVRLSSFAGGKQSSTQQISISDILLFLFETDERVHSFLLGRQIRKEDLLGTGQWIEHARAREDRKKRWWIRENLGRIQGIGKNWSYGYTVFLQQFVQPLHRAAAQHELIGKAREIELLEAALRKTNGANVMIIGEPGIGKRTVLEGLADLIAEGKVFPDLEHKQVLELSVGQVLGAGKTKGETEALLLRILGEASAAQNIIFAIDDFPEFVESLEHLGIAPGTLFDPYLENSRLHIVALGTVTSFRRILEQEKGLVSEFTQIELMEPALPELIAIIRDLVPLVEQSLHHRVIITYPALAAIADGVEHYLLSWGGAPERAVNLLQEVAQESVSQQHAFCTRETVLEYVQKKTHIPLGTIEPQEKEKLVHLEDELHKRVINQKDAIEAIANAIRRARTAMRDNRRPIGTFLFLGPTGVGKTETAKALAAVYFGNTDAMVRYDCTEYQSGDGLTRLIGSSVSNQHGMLANALRSAPYAVVLLDEFEKSHEKVQDLFLQILDEGFFTDAFGERVSMRNCIIIATSNAGSVFILDALQKKIPVSEMQTGVISHIQSNGIFKPELLNRFDSVIVFTPLGAEELQQVARLMLQGLAIRLKKQNLNLRLTDDLVQAVATGGYSATFGARPMRRFIQDRIEKVIADRIIAGSLKDGDTIVLTAQELSSDAAR